MKLSLLLLVLLMAGCIENTQEQPQIFVVLTCDAEEKEAKLGLHGGIMEEMLKILEEEGLKGKMDILVPVDLWKEVERDNPQLMEMARDYPISLHCDRHARFTHENASEQRRRINESTAWLKEKFPEAWSGTCFRAPDLRIGETTRDVLDEFNVSYDLTPQIYGQTGVNRGYLPVKIRENLSLLPTSVVLTAGHTDTSGIMGRAYFHDYFTRVFDDIYKNADSPQVVVIIIHPTNWNFDTVHLFRDGLRHMKEKEGVVFVTTGELESFVPVLGKRYWGNSPRVGVRCVPREDYGDERSFDDETVLLWVLRGYGINASAFDERGDFDAVVTCHPLEGNIEIESASSSVSLQMSTDDLINIRNHGSRDEWYEKRAELLERVFLSLEIDPEEFTGDALSQIPADNNSTYAQLVSREGEWHKRLYFGHIAYSEVSDFAL